MKKVCACLLFFLCILPLWSQRAAFTFFGFNGPAGTPNLIRWFRADSYSQADGSTLSTDWIDLSGHANATIVSTKEPTFQVGVFGTNMPAIRFTAGKYLTNATMDLTNFTIAAVTRNVADFIFLNLVNSNMQVRVGRSGADVSSMNFDVTTFAEIISSSANLGLSTPRIQFYRRSGTNVDFRINGSTLAVSGSNSNGAHLVLNSISSLAGTSAGDLGELCVWNTYLDDTTLNNLYYNYFQPTWHLPGMPFVWWKTDTFVGATNNQPVSTSRPWVDATGNGYNASQNTAANQPVVNLNKWIGSVSAVANTNTATFLTNAPITLAADFTVICVSSNSTSDGYMLGSSLANRQFRINRSGANVISFYAGGSEVISTTLGAANTTTRCLVWRRSSGTVSFRENKTARGTGSDSNSTTVNQVFNNTGGGGGAPGGFWGEIIIYNSFVSDTDVDALYDNYLKPKYNLP